MVAPLIGLAVGAAARALAKKVASDAAKKRVSSKLTEGAARLIAKKIESDIIKKVATPSFSRKIFEGADAAKTPQIAKNSVKVKRAANPPKLDAVQKLRLKASRPASGPRNQPFGEWSKPTVKINTDPTKPKGIFGPLKKKIAAADTPVNRAKRAKNARGLKAANAKVSKNNRNRFGDGEMSAYLKSAKPARANRTRAGKSVPK